jgi:hypothetical protein
MDNSRLVVLLALLVVVAAHFQEAWAAATLTTGPRG